MVELMMEMNSDWCLFWPFAHADHMARRVCEAANGPKPSSDRECCHSCNNNLCINKNHLRWGTREENAGDRKKKRNHLTVTIKFK